jgi:hypothetical protein
MNTTISLEAIEKIHFEATQAAEAAAAKFFQEKLGGRDQYACGFAWVSVFEKASTKLGRKLKEVGFRRSYDGGLQLWNPSNFGCQNVDTLEEGAKAYAEVLKQYGIQAYAGSRLD